MVSSSGRSTSHLASFPDPNDEGEGDSGSILDRFISPRIDDIGLPLADALVAQIVAPSFQVFFIGLTQSPIPTWLRPGTQTLFATRGSLLAPTLIHGAGLACCWTLGALAARAFEAEAFNVSGGRGYSEVVARTLKAGAFATGVLIIATQVNLTNELGGYVRLGESDVTDIRIFTAFDELLKDILFEASTLFGWRIYRASLTAHVDNDA